MSELLGQLWRWPMHSPRRLLGTLVVLVAVVVGVAALTSSSEQPSAAPAPSPSTVPVSSAPTLEPAPAASSASPSPTPSKDYGQALTLAREFVTAWASHEPDYRRWYASVASRSTDEFAARLAMVEPANVPATRVTGNLRLTDTGGTTRTEVAVPTDTGLVSVTMLLDRDGTWLVSDIQPGAQTEAG